MARQRSPKAHQGALAAAFALFAKQGIDRTSMDAICELSGVSKATIYKHWANKEALLLEVLADVSGLRERPVFDSGDVRADLLGVLSYRPPQRRAKMLHRLMPHLIAYSAHNVKFGATWRTLVMDPPRRELTCILARGVAQKELRPDLDKNVALALLLGPLLYSKIFLAPRSRLPHNLPEKIVDAFWRAFAQCGSAACQK